ncbi:MAG: dihydrofolate reductase [Clostridiales bacterium]|nr:dihydrofolate reductase [Clostridiales bacterium]
MARKLVVFIAISLDGYLATRNESLDWLTGTKGEGDNGYGDFIATMDTILMGRRTYDWLLRNVGAEQFPYREQRCYVVTSTPLEPPVERVLTVSGDPVEFARYLKAEAGKSIWVVGGGKLIQALQEQRLIDEWVVTVAPILLGDGIPLFGKQDASTELTLDSVRRYNQFVQMHYRTNEPSV